MKVFLAAWGVAWVVVAIGAWRAVRGLLAVTYDEDTTPSREAVREASKPVLRWAGAMVAMGVVMGLVSPWL